jgi:hypothetical protein
MVVMQHTKIESIKQTRKLLEDLCDPGKTPRVPSMVRNRARVILKEYLQNIDID